MWDTLVAWSVVRSVVVVVLAILMRVMEWSFGVMMVAWRGRRSEGLIVSVLERRHRLSEGHACIADVIYSY